MSPQSYLRNLLTNVSDVHHCHTRVAVRNHLHVNQVHKEYGKKAISYRLTQLRNSYCTNPLLLLWPVFNFTLLRISSLIILLFQCHPKTLHSPCPVSSLTHPYSCYHTLYYLPLHWAHQKVVIWLNGVTTIIVI